MMLCLGQNSDRFLPDRALNLLSGTPRRRYSVGLLRALLITNNFKLVQNYLKTVKRPFVRILEKRLYSITYQEATVIRDSTSLALISDL